MTSRPKQQEDRKVTGSNIVHQDFSRIDRVLEAWSEWLIPPRTTKARTRELETRLSRVLQRPSYYAVVRVRMPARASSARHSCLRTPPAVTHAYVFVDPNAPPRVPGYSRAGKLATGSQLAVQTGGQPFGQLTHANDGAAQLQKIHTLLNNVAMDLRRALTSQAAQKELDGFAQIVELKSRTVCRREHKVLEVRGSEGEFDLIPAISWIKTPQDHIDADADVNANSASADKLKTPYYKLNASELDAQRMRTCALCTESGSDLFVHCSMAEAERAHLSSSSSPFTLSVVRLAKYWDRTLYFGAEEGTVGTVFALDETRSHMLEAVAVRAARMEERAVEEEREHETEQRMRQRPSIGRAFAQFLDLIAHFSSLAIDTQGDHFDSLHVPLSVWTQRPLVLSALCPQTNLASDFVGRWELCRPLEDLAAAALQHFLQVVHLTTYNSDPHREVWNPQEENFTRVLLADVFAPQSSKSPNPHRGRAPMQIALRDKPRYLDVNVVFKDYNSDEKSESMWRVRRGRFVSRQSIALLEAYVNASLFYLHVQIDCTTIKNVRSAMIDLSSVFRQVDSAPRKTTLKLALKRAKVPSINSGTFVKSKPNTTFKSSSKSTLENSSSTTNSEKKERSKAAVRAKPKSLVPKEDPPYGSSPRNGWKPDRSAEMTFSPQFGFSGIGCYIVNVRAQWENE